MTSLFDLPFEEPDAVPLLPSPPAAAPPVERVQTVSELTSALRRLIEGRFSAVLVEGEVSNCRPASSGHLYFTLKDEAAQIRCVMFKTAARHLKFRVENGQHLVVRGTLSVYEPRGEYQIVCDDAEPQGRGALQLALEQLKKTLAADGLFDPSRKRPIPALPRIVGVVTSLEGAAIRDIVTVLSARYPDVHLLIRPARVQGEGAAADVARGLAALARVDGVDVIIVGRGGGSIEDLWAFNEDVVARAIAACPVPVISAVGHETDFTIADFVADVRAATPSAAAALVAAGHSDVCAALDRSHGRLEAAIDRRVLLLRGRVHALAARPALAGWPGRVALRSRQVGDLAQDLARAVRARMALRARRLDVLDRRLEARDLRRRTAAARARMATADAGMASAVLRRRHAHDARLGTLAARLHSLSPLAVLGRGYAVCWDRDRKTIVRDAADVATGTAVRVVLARGTLDAAVTATSPAPSEPRP